MAFKYNNFGSNVVTTTTGTATTSVNTFSEDSVKQARANWLEGELSAQMKEGKVGVYYNASFMGYDIVYDGGDAFAKIKLSDHMLIDAIPDIRLISRLTDEINQEIGNYSREDYVMAKLKGEI